MSLGCGKKQRPGWIGLDVVDFGWNVVWDATKDPIPLGSDSVTFVEAENFLEHIERKFWIPLMNECHRILKPGGVMEIICPDGEHLNYAMADPTHVSLMMKGTITKYFTGERPRNASYGILPWEVIECRSYIEKDPRAIFARIKPRKL